MLVLTRKLGEAITIGDNIKIVVMQIKGRQVRIGVQAPASESVYREEVYQKITEENKNASKIHKSDLDEFSRFIPEKIEPSFDKPIFKSRKK